MPEPTGGTPGSATPPAAGSPPAGTQDDAANREKWIPRERFDEVNTKAKQLEQEAADAKTAAEYYKGLATSGSTPSQDPATPPSSATPSSDEALPSGYTNWEEWYASDPGAATDYRARKTYREERTKTEFMEGRQRFLSDVYQKNPNLSDPVKRTTDPVYIEFSKLIKENPVAGATEKSLRQTWELAEIRSGKGKDYAAGAAAEAARQAAINGGSAPIGNGSPSSPMGGGNAVPAVSPTEMRVVNKYFGGSVQEYAKWKGESTDREAFKIPMKYEKAKRG